MIPSTSRAHHAVTSGSGHILFKFQGQCPVHQKTMFISGTWLQNAMDIFLIICIYIYIFFYYMYIYTYIYIRTFDVLPSTTFGTCDISKNYLSFKHLRESRNHHQNLILLRHNSQRVYSSPTILIFKNWGAQMSHENNPYYFPWNPGWLIGIPIMVYYNPYIIGQDFIPSITQPTRVSFVDQITYHLPIFQKECQTNEQLQ